MSSLANTQWNIIVANDQGGTGFGVNFLSGGNATVSPPFSTGCTYTENGSDFTLTAPETDGWPGAVTLYIGSHSNGEGSGKLTHEPKAAGLDTTFTMKKV